ncbi:hypothetical protein D9M69_714950 [compost metagenome]
MFLGRPEIPRFFTLLWVGGPLRLNRVATEPHTPTKAAENGGSSRDEEAVTPKRTDFGGPEIHEGPGKYAS